MVTADNKKLKSLIQAWGSKVTCSLDDDNDWQSYKVVGDSRVPENVILSRVTTISTMINKPELNNWIVNQSLGYIRDNLFREMRKNKNVKAPTDVLREVIVNASRHPNKARDTAGNFGTECHDLLEKLSKDPNTEVPDKFSHIVNVWQEWMQESGLETLSTEQSLYYYKDNIAFAGTFDYLGVDSNGDIVILDYKTSNGIYDDYALQLSAYYMAFKFIFGKFLEGRKVKGVVMKLPKKQNEGIEIATVKNIDDHAEIFKSLALRKKISDKKDTWE